MRNLFILVVLMSIAFQQINAQETRRFGVGGGINWQAAIKSFILPGEGQRYNRQEEKGNFYTFSTLTGAALTIVAGGFTEHYSSRYTDARDRIEVRRYHDNFLVARSVFYASAIATATGFLWGSSILDAAIHPRLGITLAVRNLTLSYYF